ncbi:MAG: hypothetical protein HQL30_03705 [Candidatus Omnitrophica bacterium]|nr:hypothetical protein [Candidatus Omnitrophota bacterium]
MRTNLLVLLFIVSFYSGLLIISGTLGSGFHFKDDSQILSGARGNNGTGFLAGAKKSVLDEIFKEHIRFRPFRNLHRFLEIRSFGDNFKLFYVYHTFLAVVCAYFLFLFMRAMGYDAAESLFFSFLTLIGQQVPIWWRLGVAESIGMVFFSGALFFMAKGVRSGGKAYGVISLSMLFISSLCKESFIVIVPAFFFWKVWLCSKRDNVPFIRAAAGNITAAAVLFSILAFDIYIIRHYVDIHKESMAGFGEGTFLAMMIRNPLFAAREFKLFLLDLIELIPVLVIFFGVFIVGESYFGDKRKIDALSVKKIFGTDTFKALTLFLLILIPEMALYNKTGLVHRFLLPAFLGTAFMVVYLIRRIRKDKRVTVFSKLVFFTLVFLMFIPRLGYGYFRVKYLADEGKQTNAFLKEIIRTAGVKDRILAVVDPVINCEASFTMPVYLSHYGQISGENLYYMFIFTDRVFVDKAETRRLKEEAKTRYTGRWLKDIKDPENIKTIAVFPGLEKDFLLGSEAWFNAGKYERKAFRYPEGEFVVYSDRS